MAEMTRMAVMDLLRKAGVEPDVDLLREAVRVVS